MHMITALFHNHTHTSYGFDMSLQDDHYEHLLFCYLQPIKYGERLMTAGGPNWNYCTPLKHISALFHWLFFFLCIMFQILWDTSTLWQGHADWKRNCLSLLPLVNLPWTQDQQWLLWGMSAFFCLICLCKFFMCQCIVRLFLAEVALIISAIFLHSSIVFL